MQQKIVHPSGARNATPADQIIRAASELEADLIVIGGRGKGAVAAVVLLGSVAYKGAAPRAMPGACHALGAGVAGV